MGYTTDFEGSFKLDKPLDNETFSLLKGLNETRRMARRVDEKYGIEGEFYLGSGDFGQAKEDNIIDYNTPPRTQPGLWCQWMPTEDRLHLEWDGGEKFYNYVEWLTYLIDKVLEPRDYKLTGAVRFYGEDRNDYGTICCYENQVYVVSEEISDDEFVEKQQKLLSK